MCPTVATTIVDWPPDAPSLQVLNHPHLGLSLKPGQIYSRCQLESKCKGDASKAGMDGMGSIFVPSSASRQGDHEKRGFCIVEAS